MVPDGVELEHRACPVGCAPNDREILAGSDRLGGQPGLYRVVQCRECRLLRTDPRPTPQTIGLFYGEEYAPYAAKPGTPQPAQTSLFRTWLGLTSRELPMSPPGRLLEVGCAAGDFMLEAKAAGWTVEGIEFSAPVAEVARSRGLKVRASNLEDAAAPNQPVDVIAAWMVIEHLHEPVAVLRKLRSWVRPVGHLVCSVPDASSLERRLFGDAWYALQLPTHLYHYTPRTLRRVLEEAGWTVNRVRWQPNPVNLLMSLVYAFQDRGWEGAAKSLEHFARDPRRGRVRLVMGWLLARLRQSGRMEVWAQPNLSERPPVSTTQ